MGRKIENVGKKMNLVYFIGFKQRDCQMNLILAQSPGGFVPYKVLSFLPMSFLWNFELKLIFPYSSIGVRTVGLVSHGLTILL